jgi:hypothetical protein
MTKTEIYRALAEGKQIQYRNRAEDPWVTESESDLLSWLSVDIDEGKFVEAYYRLAPAPTPAEPKYESTFRQVWNATSGESAPKLVPLGPEDVRPGDVVRSNGYHWFLVLSTHHPAGLFIQDRSLVTWDELWRLWEISHDAGQTWQRCEKEGA